VCKKRLDSFSLVEHEEEVRAIDLSAKSIANCFSITPLALLVSPSHRPDFVPFSSSSATARTVTSSTSVRGICALQTSRTAKHHRTLQRLHLRLCHALRPRHLPTVTSPPRHPALSGRERPWLVRRQALQSEYTALARRARLRSSDRPGHSVRLVYAARLRHLSGQLRGRRRKKQSR
jgi:hypothetical protein